MTHLEVLLLALLIGVVAGLRAFTAPAVMSWVAMLGWIDLDGKWLHWVAHPVTVGVLTVLAVVELISDQVPQTPSRKTALPFLARLIMGAFAASVLGAAWGYPWSSIGAGLIGAVIGTMGGYEVRTRVAAAIGGRDRFVGVLEDVVAVALGLLAGYLASAL